MNICQVYILFAVIGCAMHITHVVSTVPERDLNGYHVFTMATSVCGMIIGALILAKGI